MYSRRIVERNLERAGALIRAKYQLPRRWELRPSTPSEQAEMTARLGSLLDSKGYLTRPLSREESLWTFCESTVCKLDFGHFSSRYGRIEDWSGRIVSFKPNLAQQLILKVMAGLEERSLALMLMFLKARQLGITTLFQVLLAHRTFFYRNVGTFTGSAEEKKSREMVGKLEFLYDQLPWWLRPRRTAYRAGELLEYGDLNSSINVVWGNQKGGIARGTTPQVAHLSELSSFVDADELVDASLVRALHENPFALLGLESTAKGMGNWWHRTWDLNARWDARGLARLKPIFLPWYMGRDLYPAEATLRRRPVPAGWTEPQFVSQHAAAAKVYVESSELLRGELGEGWEMPLEQRWFYYLEYQEAKEKNQLHKFLEEMPSNPQEAFQNSNPIVFSIETLSSVTQATGSSKPTGVWQLAGPEVSLVYDQYRLRPESKPLRCLSSNGRVEAEFELRAIDLEAWPDLETDLKLYVWEEPQAGETYGLGIDPSEGVEQDSSAIVVVKKATPWHPDEQVAEFASNRVAPHDLWLWAFALAHYYTVARPGGGWNWPLVVVETNMAGGDAVQTEMLKRGWSQFHQEFEPTAMGTVGPQFQERPRSLRDRLGWRTTRINRPKIISLARKHIRDGLIVVRSPGLATELATLNWNLDKARIEAAEGSHDDRFMALAILLGAWYDPAKYGETPSPWSEAREQEALMRAIPEYTGNRIVGGVPSKSRPPEPRWDSRQLMGG